MKSSSTRRGHGGAGRWRALIGMRKRGESKCCKYLPMRTKMGLRQGRRAWRVVRTVNMFILQRKGRRRSRFIGASSGKRGDVPSFEKNFEFTTNRAAFVCGADLARQRAA